MKWDIWVQPNQIIKEEYPDGWSHEDVMRAADARYGGKVTTVSPSGVGGSPSTSNARAEAAGGGCGSFIGLIFLGIIIAGIAGGGEKQNRPSTPPESLSQPQSQVVPKTYANPAGPCVTNNFEPC